MCVKTLPLSPGLWYTLDKLDSGKGYIQLESDKEAWQ